MGNPRFVIYGAGAVGGGLGALLTRAGHEVVLIARGPHLDALRSGGLRLITPEGAETIPVTAVASPRELSLSADDVVFLTMKSNDTEPALSELEAVADPDTALVCAQNGVANERAALRRFSNVYGMWTMFPVVHLEPGVVQLRSRPVPAVLDIGRYPGGVDESAETIAAAIESAGCRSVPRPDIMRWKYAKLLRNLVNAVDAIAEPGPTATEIIDRLRVEGQQVLDAAGIEYTGDEEQQLRVGEFLRQTDPVEGAGIAGSSSWQSVARGTGRIESDYLNGEIALLGRLHGVPAPVNEFVRRTANAHVRAGRPPNSLSGKDLRAGYEAARRGSTLRPER
ncbi:ketopantoate reductase family protein [Nocardia sp. BMG111209]|uniref:ketopantoate reductase family protein n=1 Tax=Nocardia sp. BMG111209 TaxID=1160137 RepID=UPI00037C9CA6|nr:2-dehydropantoate 2-reductase [Nocardia sp. BMG111209]